MIIPRFGILVMLSVSFFIIGIAAAQTFSGPVFSSGSVWVDDEDANFSRSMSLKRYRALPDIYGP